MYTGCGYMSCAHVMYYERMCAHVVKLHVCLMYIYIHVYVCVHVHVCVIYMTYIPIYIITCVSMIGSTREWTNPVP